MQRRGLARLAKVTMFLLIMTAMFLAFTGCRQDADEAHREAVLERLPGLAPMQRFAETVTLTSVTNSELEPHFNEGHSMEHNMNTILLYERLNILVEYDWVVAAEAYDTRVNLMIATGDMPDFFMVNSIRTYLDLIEDGQIWDLTEWYEALATPRLRQVNDSAPALFNQAIIDGRLYGMPIMGNVSDSVQLMWIRKDWLDASGLPAPTTVDELEHLARVFMDMNPGAHGIAIGPEMPLSLGQAFGAHLAIWLRDDNDQIVFGTVQPEMRNAVTRMNQWFNEGIIHREFIQHEMWSGVWGEHAAQDLVGIAFFPSFAAGWPFGTINDMTIVDGDYATRSRTQLFEPHPIPTIDGRAATTQTWTSANRFWVVNQASSYPDALIQMINSNVLLLPADEAEALRNRWISMFGEDFTEDHFTFPIWYVEPESTIENSNVVFAMIEAGDPIQGALNWGWDADDPRIPGLAEAWENAMGWLDPDNFAAAGNSMSNYYWWLHNKMVGDLYVLPGSPGSMIFDQNIGSPPPSYVEFMTTLQDFLNETILRIISGESSPDDWDRYMQQWYDMGGGQITREMNEMHSAE